MKINLTRKQNPIKKYLIFLSISLVIVCSIIYFQVIRTKQITIYSTRIQSWMQKNQAKLNPTLPRLAANKTNVEPEIHFEFYTALPNMRILPTKQDVPVIKKPLAKHLAANTKKSAAKIVVADELERELAKEFQQK